MRRAAAVKKLFLLEGSSSKIFFVWGGIFPANLGILEGWKIEANHLPSGRLSFYPFLFRGDACPLAARLTGALKELSINLYL